VIFAQDCVEDLGLEGFGGVEGWERVRGHCMVNIRCFGWLSMGFVWVAKIVGCLL
jgi:hypothetical protein